MKKDKFYFLIPIITAFILAILAYYFYPVGGNFDLSKYYYLMDMIKLNDAESLTYINNYIEIIFRFYMYLITYIGNYHLLQFFPVLIFYLLLFYIIFDYGKTNNYSKFLVIVVFLLCLTLFRFALIASSIRYGLAYIIFAVGLYLELIKKSASKWIKLLYIFPIFIHKTSIILLLFRLLIEIKNKKIICIFFGLFTFLFFFPKTIIYFLTPFVKIKIIESLINMIYGYLVIENVPIYLQLIFRLLQTIFFGICGLFCFFNSKDTKEKKYFFVFVLISVFSAFLFKYFTIFMRMIDFLVFMSPIVMFEFIKLIRNYKFKLLYPCLLLGLLLLMICGVYIQIRDFQDMFF